MPYFKDPVYCTDCGLELNPGIWTTTTHLRKAARLPAISGELCYHVPHATSPEPHHRPDISREEYLK